MSYKVFKAVTVAALAVVSFPAIAQEGHKFDRAHFENLLTDQQIRMIKRSSDRVLKQYTQELYRISDDGILTAEKLERYRVSNHAMARARKIAELLGADLDGDGVVTREELSKSVGNARRFNRANAALLFLDADKDKNDEVSFAELSSHADYEVRNGRNARVHNRSVSDALMAFDKNADGNVTISEISKGIDIIAGNVSCSNVCQD